MPSEALRLLSPNARSGAHPLVSSRPFAASGPLQAFLQVTRGPRSLRGDLSSARAQTGQAHVDLLEQEAGQALQLLARQAERLAQLGPRALDDLLARDLEEESDSIAVSGVKPGFRGSRVQPSRDCRSRELLHQLLRRHCEGEAFFGVYWYQPHRDASVDTPRPRTWRVSRGRRWASARYRGQGATARPRAAWPGIRLRPTVVGPLRGRLAQHPLEYRRHLGVVGRRHLHHHAGRRPHRLGQQLVGVSLRRLPNHCQKHASARELALRAQSPRLDALGVPDGLHQAHLEGLWLL